MNQINPMKAAFPATLTNKRALLAGVLSASLCLLLTSTSARADSDVFVPETGTLDTTPSTPAPTRPADQPPTVLQGGVHKRQHPELDAGTTTNQPLQSGASDQGVQLKSAEAIRDDDPTFQMAAQKLASGQKLTGDEYRSLQMGCCGYETDRTFFTNIAKVSIVYKDGPADRAGIRKGDKILDEENDDAARKDPTQPRQEVVCGLAGSTDTINLLRHGKPTPITLTRMNIEDIEEPDIRREWEELVRKLGYPKHGKYSGTSLNNLTRVEK